MEGRKGYGADRFLGVVAWLHAAPATYLTRADQGERSLLPPGSSSILVPYALEAYSENITKTQHDLIKRAKSVLVVGGGALGLQYATDIADYYNSPQHASLRPEGTPPKKVTLMHSRGRFLPLYDEAVDVEVKRRLEVLGVDVILNERVTLPSAEELLKQEQSGEMHRIVTSTGKEVEFDLLVCRLSPSAPRTKLTSLIHQLRCTGQTPNSKLLKDFLPESVNGAGYVNVLPTLQVALPPSNRARDDIFAIGDVAEMGTIKAGHTGEPFIFSQRSRHEG